MDFERDQATQLAAFPLFSSLTDLDLKKVASKTFSKTYQPGQIIFLKDDPGVTLHLVVSGMVKICLPSESGTEIALSLIRPGDFFGELALLDGQRRSTSAVAVERTENLVLHRDDFLRLMQSHTEVTWLLLVALGARLRQANAMIANCLFSDVSSRLARKLLELAQEFGRKGPDGLKIDLMLTQGDIGSMIGASREAVNRALGSLIINGSIKIDGHTLTIRDVERLREIPTR